MIAPGRLLLAALLCLALVACPGRDGQAAGDDAPLLVFAAASLKESMDEAAAAYEATSAAQVEVSYAASSALARQIGNGAPADVFIPADADWMDWAQRQGLIDAAGRRDLLGNKLVLIAPADADATPVEPGDGRALLARLGDGRIALAMTASVPAGRYAREAFTALGVWEGVAPRAAEADNVRAALMLVARGEAPLGVVYASDALAEARVQVVADFPPTSHPPIIYPVARTAASDHPAANDFIAWLASPEAGAIFRRHGFTPL